MTPRDRARYAWLATLHAALLVAAQRLLGARDDGEAARALDDMGFILRRMALTLEP